MAILMWNLAKAWMRGRIPWPRDAIAVRAKAVPSRLAFAPPTPGPYGQHGSQDQEAGADRTE
jgi:hypothetical protein